MTMGLLWATFLCWTVWTLKIASADGSKDSYDCNTYKEYKGCPTDCSQSHSRAKGEKEFFNCTVGGKLAVEKYISINKKAFLMGIEKTFDSPILTSIDFHFLDNSPSLAIGFSLPKSKREASALLHPPAVLLDFQGLQDLRAQDAYYSHCPRQRLFSIHNYNPEFAIDAENPRNLSYDCLLGLDNTSNEDNKRAYNVTLTTAYGNSSTYIVTVHNMPEIGHLWFPVIATRLSVTERLIYVVFERAPVNHKVQSYRVLLLKVPQVRVELKEVHGGEPIVVFTDVKKGTYVVQVTPIGPCGDSNGCKSFVSYHIDGQLLQEDSHDYLNGSLGTLKLVAMVMGCLFAICVLLVVVCFVQKKRKCHDDHTSDLKLKGIILHPFLTNSPEEKCVEKFGEYLKGFGYCILLPVNDKMSLRQEVQDNCTFVIVFYLDRCRCRSSYAEALSEVVSIKKTQNSLHIIPVTFPFCQNETKPRELSGLETLHLMRNTKELFSKIIDLDSLSQAKRDLLNESLYVKCPEGKALADALSDALNVNRDMPEENSPLLGQDVDKPTEGEMTENNDQPVTPEYYKDLQERIMKINSNQPKILKHDEKTEGMKMTEKPVKKVVEDECVAVKNENCLLRQERTEVSRHLGGHAPENIRMTGNVVRAQPYENKGNPLNTSASWKGPNRCLSAPEDYSHSYDHDFNQNRHLSLPCNSRQTALSPSRKPLHQQNGNIHDQNPFAHNEFNASHIMPFTVAEVLGEQDCRNVCEEIPSIQICNNLQGSLGNHEYTYEGHYQGQGQQETLQNCMVDHQMPSGDYRMQMNSHMVNSYSTSRHRAPVWFPDNDGYDVSRGERTDFQFSLGINPAVGTSNHWLQERYGIGTKLPQRMMDAADYERCQRTTDTSVKNDCRNNRIFDDLDFKISADDTGRSQSCETGGRTKSTVVHSLQSDYDSFDPVPPTDEDDESLSEDEQFSEMLKINQNYQR